jgi:hypothetical protein
LPIRQLERRVSVRRLACPGPAFRSRYRHADGHSLGRGHRSRRRYGRTASGKSARRDGLGTMARGTSDRPATGPRKGTKPWPIAAEAPRLPRHNVDSESTVSHGLDRLPGLVARHT